MTLPKIIALNTMRLRLCLHQKLMQDKFRISFPIISKKHSYIKPQKPT
jgi:hypothetical protein